MSPELDDEPPDLPCLPDLLEDGRGRHGGVGGGGVGGRCPRVGGEVVGFGATGVCFISIVEGVIEKL